MKRVLSSKIENRPISEAEKAANMEEVMQAVAESGTKAGLFEEAEKFKNIHEQNVKNEYSKELAPEEIQEIRKGAKIEIDETGEGIINITSDILKDVPRKNWINRVKTVIKSIFPHGFYLNGEYVEVSNNSRKEFTSSKYSKRLAYENPEIYADKMKAAPYLDMISQNAKDYNRENAEHGRKDNIVEFERGNITLKIGKKEYVADVVIGVKDNGGKKFYDITNIENKKSPQPGQQKADTREGGLIDVLSSNNIISPVDGKSNPPSIGNNVFGAGIFEKGEAEAVSAEVTESAKRVQGQMVQRPEIQSTTGRVNPENESTNAFGPEIVNKILGIPDPAKQAELDRTVEIGTKLGVNVVFDETLNVDGTHFADGTIVINPNTENPIRQVLIHELTHDIETSGLYENFSGRILEHAKNAQGINLEQMRETVIREYAEAGETLTPELADREIVAKFAEQHLFTDEKAIERLCDTDPSLFHRIKYWIEDMIGKFRGTAEERFLIDAQRLYEKALATRGERPGMGVEQYLIREEFENEIDKWFNNTTPNQRLVSPGYFKIGTTSDVLKSIGVRDGEVYWRKYKIGAILQDHPEMSEETIKKVPQILEKPYIVMKSATREDSIVLFGELKAENGNNVMAALLLTLQASGNKIEADFSLLTSAHGNRDNKNIANLVNNSEILFIDTNKNRAETWLMQLGVQFPSRQPTNSSIGSIFYQDGKVNIKGKKLSELGGAIGKASNQHSVGSSYDELAAEAKTVSMERADAKLEAEDWKHIAEGIDVETGIWRMKDLARVLDSAAGGNKFMKQLQKAPFPVLFIISKGFCHSIFLKDRFR